MVTPRHAHGSASLGQQQQEFYVVVRHLKGIFFISKLHTLTQDNVIKDYLKDNGLSNFDLQLVSNSVSTFKSYKLSVSMEDKDKVLQPTLWPKGILVQKWFQKSRYYNHENHAESSND